MWFGGGFLSKRHNNNFYILGSNCNCLWKINLGFWMSDVRCKTSLLIFKQTFKTKGLFLKQNLTWKRQHNKQITMELPIWEEVRGQNPVSCSIQIPFPNNQWVTSIHWFILQAFTGHLFCRRHCTRHWKDNGWIKVNTISKAYYTWSFKRCLKSTILGNSVGEGRKKGSK